MRIKSAQLTISLGSMESGSRLIQNYNSLHHLKLIERNRKFLKGRKVTLSEQKLKKCHVLQNKQFLSHIPDEETKAGFPEKVDAEYEKVGPRQSNALCLLYDIVIP